MRLITTLLTAALLSSSVLAYDSYLTPERLNPLEITRLFNTYDCPYPTGDYKVEHVSEFTLELTIYSGGNVCFDGDHAELEAEFVFGILPAGEYTLKYTHSSTPNSPIQWQTTSFVVENRIPFALAGLWGNTEQPGHGVSLYVTDDDQVVIYWLTYDKVGQPLWLVGVSENNATELSFDAYRTEGMLFADFDPDTLQLIPWGQLNISFDDCKTATLSWSADQPFGNGEMPIELALPAGSSTCDR